MRALGGLGESIKYMPDLVTTFKEQIDEKYNTFNPSNVYN